MSKQKMGMFEEVAFIVTTQRELNEAIQGILLTEDSVIERDKQIKKSIEKIIDKQKNARKWSGQKPQ